MQKEDISQRTGQEPVLRGRLWDGAGFGMVLER
jgi:hypothetical protein